MAAYWLTFTPLGPRAPRGWPIESLQHLVRQFNSNPATATEWWRLASHKSASVGDRVYLFKQGSDPRGIFGVGHIVDGPEFRGDTSGDEEPRWRAKILFEKLVDPTERFLLRLEEIDNFVPASCINAQASGNSIPEECRVELERRLAPLLTPVAAPIKSEEADDPGFDPESLNDLQERALRAIRIRRGQPAFRAALMEAYAGRCAIIPSPEGSDSLWGFPDAGAM